MHEKINEYCQGCGTKTIPCDYFMNESESGEYLMCPYCDLKFIRSQENINNKQRR